MHRILIALLLGALPLLAAPPLELRAQRRTRSGADSWELKQEVLSWPPQKTAAIVCDMWDTHTCPAAAARVAEMAPRMNDLLKNLRARGVLIIHCPSDTMGFYAGTPQRLLAQQAPVSIPPVPLQKWCRVDPEREPPLPIDDSDGGCDCPRTWKKGDPYPWTRQIATLEIAPQDAITDSAEAYHLLQQRGIDHLILMGVHTNMCVLGRPFGIRQMVAQGKHVALVRDLTDAMYNPERPPHVSHAEGTALVVAHIEKYWCHTFTSDSVLGGTPFRFHEPKQ